MNEIKSSVEQISLNRRDNRRGMLICSNDGGRILTLYVRVFGVRNSRFFQSINMLQCETCFQFFAMVDGTKNLVPLVVKRKEVNNKNGRTTKGRT